ncbi:MAG: major facilitator transporter, partial [Phenylobacterium sp.]|nr:major facilitator transporter [Phenylobacterium sp.]
LIAEHVPHARLGAANGLMSQGLSLGPAFGVLVGGLLMADLGWRRVFLVFGALSLTWLIPWLAAARTARRAGPAEPAAESPPAFLEILKRRELWGLSLGHVTGNYGFYFVVSWLPLYLVKARGFSVAQMATVGGTVYLVYAAAAFAGGWLTDRWIAAGATQGRARKTAAVVAHLLGATGLIVTAWGGPVLSLFGLVLTATGFGIVNPHTFATAQVLAGPRAAGKWMGVQNCLGNLSGIIGPLVTGAIIDRTGGFKGAFAVTAAVVIVGLIGWVGLIPRVEPLAWRSAPRA